MKTKIIVHINADIKKQNAEDVIVKDLFDELTEWKKFWEEGTENKFTFSIEGKDEEL